MVDRLYGPVGTESVCLSNAFKNGYKMMQYNKKGEKRKWATRMFSPGLRQWDLVTVFPRSLRSKPTRGGVDLDGVGLVYKSTGVSLVDTRCTS